VKCTNRVIVSILLCLTILLSVGCGSNSASANLKDPFNAYSSSGLTLKNQSGSNALAYFGKNLCIGGTSDVGLKSTDSQVTEGAGLFNTATGAIPYAKNIYGKLYPASTTKILTCLIAIEKGNLDDVVTVSQNALNLEAGSSVCGLKVGDQITLRDLLYGLMMRSGNDAAVAIAEHISGSVDAFAQLMNQKAAEIGATGSHFVNANGLPNDQHYTTVYDMYLIFNAAIQNDTFLKVIETKNHTTNYKDSQGAPVTQLWNSTNKYLAGTETSPAGVTVLGGKTGTTGEAGYCLVLLSQNSSGQKLISIVFKADCRSNLYLLMNQILSQYGN